MVRTSASSWRLVSSAGAAATPARAWRMASSDTAGSAASAKDWAGCLGLGFATAGAAFGSTVATSAAAGESPLTP